MALLFIGAITLLLFTGYVFGRMDKYNKDFRIFINHHSLSFRLLVSLVLYVLLTWSAIHLQNSDPTKKFDNAEFAKYIVSGLVVIGLLYTVLTFEFTVKTKKSDERYQLSLTTYTAISQWHAPPLIEYSKTIGLFETTFLYEMLKKDAISFEQFYASTDGESIRTAVSGIFNYFEVISAAIEEKIMDESFVKKFFFAVFKAYYIDWIEFIKIRRINTNDNDLWNDFTTLVQKWESESLKIKK
jgi:hypothetical protein